MALPPSKPPGSNFTGREKTEFIFTWLEKGDINPPL